MKRRQAIFSFLCFSVSKDSGWGKSSLWQDACCCVPRVLARSWTVGFTPRVHRTKPSQLHREQHCWAAPVITGAGRWMTGHMVDTTEPITFPVRASLRDSPTCTHSLHPAWRRLPLPSRWSCTRLWSRNMTTDVKWNSLPFFHMLLHTGSLSDVLCLISLTFVFMLSFLFLSQHKLFYLKIWNSFWEFSETWWNLSPSWTSRDDSTMLCYVRSAEITVCTCNHN